MRVREISSPFKKGVAYLKFGGGSNNLKLLNYFDGDGQQTNYHVDGGGGDDQIRSHSDGDDKLIGGEGSDLVTGGFGNDLIYLGLTSGEDAAKGKGDLSNAGYGEFDGTFVVGDGEIVVAGADRLIGGDNGDNQMSGDFEHLVVASGGSVTMGSDVGIRSGLNGGNNGTNTIVGDAMSVTLDVDQSQDLPLVIFGNDVLDGGTTSFDLLVGDARTLTFDVDDAVPEQVVPAVTGGDDVIRSDGLATELIGDFEYVQSNGHRAMVTGGDDLLEAGRGDDVMWGDVKSFDSAVIVVGGADTFQFVNKVGTDAIMDFEIGTDTLDFGTSVTEAMISLMLANASQDEGATLLDYGHVGGSGTLRIENTWDDAGTVLTLADFGFEMIG